MKACEAGEALLHKGIKLLKVCGTSKKWAATDAMCQLAVAGARAEEPEANLRILKRPKSLQEGAGCLHPGGSMRGNIRVISNGSPKQLEALLHAAGAIRITQEFTGEVRQEGMLRQVANGDKLALKQVERKAKLSAALNDPAKRSRDSYNKVQASRSASQLLGKGLQGGSEEQRAKGVALLDAPSRRDAANAATSQAGRLGIPRTGQGLGIGL